MISNDHELNKLNQIEYTLEKQIRQLMVKCTKSDCDFEKDLTRFFEASEKLRQETELVKKNIQHIIGQIKEKAHLLKSKSIGEIKDFDKFKCEMISIQERIIETKQKSKSEIKNLKGEEDNLNDELDLYYNAKVSEWSQLIDVSRHEFVPSKLNNKISGECKEVKHFFDFIHQTGGHENGWRKEDHLLFLKMRSKHKKANELARHLHEILPDISMDEIKSHEEWYQKYLHLQSKKKEAISKWRSGKSSAVCVTNSNENATKCSITSRSTTEQCGAKLREQLLHWKMQKEEKLLMEKETETQKINEIIEKERVKRQKQVETKKIVNEWKESKILFEQSQRKHQQALQELERKRRATIANKLIKQFQSMDELYVLKMRRVHSQQMQKSPKRFQSSSSAVRDPNRLLKPTIQWTHKVNALREPLQEPVPIKTIPKLGVPEWRKNINK